MTGETLVREMSRIGDDLILAAEETAVCRHFAQRRSRYRRWIATAAGVALFAAAIPAALMWHLSSDRTEDGQPGVSESTSFDVIWRNSNSADRTEETQTEMGEEEKIWNGLRVSPALYKALTAYGEDAVLAVLVRADNPGTAAQVREDLAALPGREAGKNTVVFLCAAKLKDWHFDWQSSCVFDLAAFEDITG